MTQYCEFSSKPLLGQTLERKPPFRDYREIFKYTCRRHCPAVCLGSEMRGVVSSAARHSPPESTYLPRAPAVGI